MKKWALGVDHFFSLFFLVFLSLPHHLPEKEQQEGHRMGLFSPVYTK